MDIKSLTRSFTKAARNLFGIPEKPVIPFSRFERALELDSPQYKRERYRQPIVMQYMNLAVNTRGADVYGAARCAYADPYKRIVKPGVSGMDIEASRDEHIRSSAAILTADYMIGFGRRAFVAVIRNDVPDIDRFFSTMVFGLYGTYDKDGNLKIRKMLVPDTDPYRRMTGLREADLSDPAAVETALSYIELCKNQVFGGGPLYARDNWRAAREGIELPTPRPENP